MGLGEWFAALKRTPGLHRNPRQMQFSGHHKAIATVVAWTDQHQGSAPLQLRPPILLLQPLRHGQRGFLHQGFNRQPAVEQLLLEGCHAAAAHQQM